MLIHHFQDWLKAKNISSTSKVLCAVSGGIDSMVLLNLFQREGFTLEVVHLNYNLRGEESIMDQKLVEKICQQYGFTLHLLSPKNSENKNVQEWARNQRLNYFKKLKAKFDFDYIALAHHDEDQLETILLSIFKGYSLQTIDSIRDYFIRPLLGVDKALINEYASANDIEYRLDKSNLSSDYDRNFLRNQIIPQLKNRIPKFKKRILKFAERQKDEAKLLSKLVDQIISRFLKNESNNIGSYHYQKINLQILKEENGKEVLIFYLKSNYKFSQGQINDLLESIKAEAEILNENYLAQKNRNFLYIGSTKLEDSELDNEKPIIKNSIVKSGFLPYLKHNLFLHKDDSQDVKNRKGKLVIDYDKIKFPMELRKGIHKEDFYAFGLKGAKTELGKFLKKNEKPSHFRAQEYILVDCLDQIIIPGIEIDFRLRVENHTKSCLIIDFKDNSEDIIVKTYQD